MAEIMQKIKNELTLQKVLAAAIKAPGIKVRRDVFLRKELIKFYHEDVVERAIAFNPARAGIEKSRINSISKTIINYETTKVTTVSVAASLPSSAAAPAAIGAAAADITSYFVFILRATQELAYLYGFEQFDFAEDNVDSETMNLLLIFLGVMFGTQGAASTLNKVANTLAAHVAKKLSQQPLAKGTIFPIVKQVATKIGIRMTKQIFADTVASAIPVIGSLMSGGLTYVMFRPCCMKLRRILMHYNLCDPDYYKQVSHDDSIVIADIDEDDRNQAE